MIQAPHKYRMTISRTTIDKLGIKLYDKVSAVLSELIANAYDADATRVRIALPLDTYLARKTAGNVIDEGFEIRIEDDGHGMTADEVNAYYLKVGINRRTSRGETTPGGRKVMGRKGIGKLAPFGICKEVEVMAAGGSPDSEGYVISNLILNFDGIFEETDQEYNPRIGSMDGQHMATTGTTIVLRNFDRRRVPNSETLHRQVAARYGISRPDWRVEITDVLGNADGFYVGTLPIEKMEGTEIDVSERAGPEIDGVQFPVKGWVAYSKDSYRDEAMAGVRIFARGKIVAQTRDFGLQPGFTGEFKMRSYVVGEIHADWLDDEEDLIRSDRQDIIWNSELGLALQEWGSKLLRDLAAKSDVSVSSRVWDEFLQVSRLDERLTLAAPDDPGLRSSVRQAARLFVGRHDRDAIRDNPDYAERIVNLAFTLGPQRDLLDTLDKVVESSPEDIELIIGLFEKAGLVEIYSLGQVAQRRVDSVERLRTLVSTPKTLEDKLQRLIEKAPWILYPDWTPLSFNQSLSRTRMNFEAWYKANYREEIVTSAIANPTKEPDFVMLNYEGRIEIVEIKRPQHNLTDEEFDRAFKYLTAMNRFIEENAEVRQSFQDAKLTIVCDGLNLRNAAYSSLIDTNDQIDHKRWLDILQSTTRAHEDFLSVVDNMKGQLPEPDVNTK